MCPKPLNPLLKFLNKISMRPNEYLGTLLYSYVGGLVLLLLGIIKVYRMSKSNDKVDGSILQPYLRGWFTGIALIVLGIVVIILKLMGKQ